MVYNIEEEETKDTTTTANGNNNYYDTYNYIVQYRARAHDEMGRRRISQNML